MKNILISDITENRFTVTTLDSINDKFAVSKYTSTSFEEFAKLIVDRLEEDASIVNIFIDKVHVGIMLYNSVITLLDERGLQHFNKKVIAALSTRN